MRIPCRLSCFNQPPWIPAVDPSQGFWSECPGGGEEIDGNRHQINKQ